MKILIYIIPFAVLLVGISGVVIMNPSVDIPTDLNSENWYSNLQYDTNRPPNFPYPTEWNFNFANNPNLNSGTVGALLLNGKYYLNNWMNRVCFILPNNGPNGSPSITGIYAGGGVYRIRDLTTDGQFIYSGAASSILYKMDASVSVVAEFSLTGVIRGITWDPNRKAFWYCDFSSIIQCRDTANVQKASGIINTLTAKYGLAFDSTSSVDSAFIYVWSQETTQTNRLCKYFVTPAEPLLLNDWIFNLWQQYIGPAGGAEIIIDPYTSPPRLMLLLNYQNFAVVGYKLKDVLLGLEAGNELVRDYILNQNYPNPFNPVTRISFVLSKAGLVRLEVFNTIGEKVSTIFSGHTQAGEHEYIFDASNLSSGVYYYRLTVDETYVTTKKMILVK